MQQPPDVDARSSCFVELCAIPSPPGDERAVADRVDRASSTRSGSRGTRTTCGPTIGASAGQRPLPAARPEQARRAALPLRPLRHGSARRARSSPSSTDGVRPERRRHDPRRGQQVGARRHGRGGTADRRARAARTRASSSSSRRRRRSASSARPRSTSGGSRRGSATSTTRRRRSATSSSARRRRRSSRLDVRGARRARGDVPGGGALRDRRGRARDRRHAARAARRGDDRQRRR